ncbi:MAG TPA: hypothetical protein VFQ58_02075, partial [Flavisolibacter sp.]|nr:hypothetical protein [Flavisolibacter sp.]
MLALLAQSKQKNAIPILLVLQFFLVYFNNVKGQVNIKSSTTNKTASTRFSTKRNTDLFNTNKCFIKNVGQYNDSNAAYKNMGEKRYGFEGFTMPVLFTDKGLVYLQVK